MTSAQASTDTSGSSTSDARAKQALSFGQAADIYEQARPSYPQDALDFLLPPGSPRVVDLGAGTGKFTRLIAARGVEVTAVEPSDGMREQLHELLPDVPALKGTAEQLPLEDHSVDAVLVAQAWHWVDVPRASVEVARVLKPGGWLGLVWNQRDYRADWIVQLEKLAKSGPGRGSQPENPNFGDAFGQIEYSITEWENPITPQGVLDLIASRSAMIVATEEERQRVFGRVQELLDTHPDLVGRTEFAVPYVTYASRARVK